MSKLAEHNEISLFQHGGRKSSPANLKRTQVGALSVPPQDQWVWGLKLSSTEAGDRLWQAGFDKRLY